MAPPARSYLPTFPASFAVTRAAVHALARHVLGAVVFEATGRCELRPAADGVETPPFGPGDRVIGVEGDELVDRDRSGERRAPITTVRDAARFVGVAPGVPGGRRRPVTTAVLDEPLAVERAAVQALADWYAVSAAALAAVARAGAALDPVTLRPDRFDLVAFDGRALYGGSPGDGSISVPHVYVRPRARPFPAARDGFWNAPFGAALRCDEMESPGTAADFLVRGFALTTRP